MPPLIHTLTVPHINFRQQVLLTLTGAIIFLQTGCNEPPQIATQRVPKSRTGLMQFRNEASSNNTDSQFPTPEGWKRGKSDPMFPSDKFLKTVDNNEVVLSIMSLPASNEWESNVQRWVGQVGLEKTPEQISELTKKLDIDGVESSRIKLVDEAADSKAIIAIMAPKGNIAWFIKLMGKKEAVESTEDEFDKYISSLKLP